VADKVEAATKVLETADGEQREVLSAQLKALHQRSVALDVAVVLGAVGGAATCGAMLAMFIGALSERTMASVLFGLFGIAVVCALCAIVAFATRCCWLGLASEPRSRRGEDQRRTNERFIASHDAWSTAFPKLSNVVS